jgi:hypothetical protein
MTQPGEDLHAPDGLYTASRDVEAPDADAMEQALPADPADRADVRPSVPFDVNEADAIEQAQSVELDDDYR